MNDALDPKNLVQIIREFIAYHDAHICPSDDLLRRATDVIYATQPSRD